MSEALEILVRPDARITSEKSEQLQGKAEAARKMAHETIGGDGNGDETLPDDDLWVSYKRDPSNIRLRNALMEMYMPLVKYNGERIWTKLPEGVELDDLISAGTFGLMDAIDGFDLSRGIKFETYCVPRIRGSILDELRTMDWVPRLVRSKATKLNEAKRTLETKFGRPPNQEELASELTVTQPELEKMMFESTATSVMSLSKKWYETDSYKDVNEVDIIEDKRAEDPTQPQFKMDLLRSVTKGCSREERLILILYYWENLTMKEIGATLYLSESRVSQVHSALMKRLRGIPSVAVALGIDPDTAYATPKERKNRHLSLSIIAPTTEDNAEDDIDIEDALDRSLELMNELITSFEDDTSDEAKKDLTRYRLQQKVLENIGKNLSLFVGGENINLRINQLGALKAYVKFLGDPNQKGIGYFRQPTGAGKTGLFGTIIRLADVPTLVLVPTTNLLEQTMQDFTDLVRIPKEDIGMIGGGKYESGRKVTIATYQSHLSRMKIDAEYREHVCNCKLVVCDEAHKSLGNATQQSIDEINMSDDGEVTEQEENTQDVVLSDVEEYTSKTALKLGFTATPILAAKSVEATYKTLIADASLSELVRSGLLKKYKVMQVEGKIQPGEIDQRINSEKESQLLEREHIYESLLDAYRQATEEVTERLLGFATCSSIEECDRFSSLGEKFGFGCVVVTSREYQMQPGVDHKKAAESALLSGEKDIIVSVDKLKEGWNFPPLNAVILARATLSPVNILQPAGRASRAFGDQKYAYIFEAKWNTNDDGGGSSCLDSPNGGSTGGNGNGHSRQSLTYKKPLTLADAVYLSGENDVHGVCEGWGGEHLKYKALPRLDANGEVILNDEICVGLNRYAVAIGMQGSSLIGAVKEADLAPLGQALSLMGWVVDVYEKEKIEQLPFVRRWREKPSDSLDENGEVFLDGKQGVALRRYAVLHGMDVAHLQNAVRSAALALLGKAKAGNRTVDIFRKKEVERLPYVQSIQKRLGEILDETGEISVNGVVAVGTNRFAKAHGMDTQLLKDAVKNAHIPRVGSARSGVRTVPLYPKSQVVKLPYVQKSLSKNGHPVLNEQGEVSIQGISAIGPNKFADVRGLVAATLQKHIEAAGLVSLGIARSGVQLTNVYEKEKVMQLPVVRRQS